MTGMRESGRRSMPILPQKLVTVKLACGDQITAKNPPLSSKSVYGCEAGKGHGYSVRWVSYTNNSSEITRQNPDFVPSTREGGK